MHRRMMRGGVTLIEMVVVLFVVGIVATAIGSVLRGQQRFFGSAAAIVEQRVSLRDATGMLPAELRALSPAHGDVIAFSDSALEMRATIAAAIVCDTLAGGMGVDLAQTTAGVHPLAAFTTAPQPGDLVFVYTDGPTDRATDDTWRSAELSAASPAAGACAWSPFVARDDTAVAPLRLRLSAPLAEPVRPGAFVRILRRVRYRFYRAGTGEWYLGYSEWGAGGYAAVQPVTGPFAPYARGPSGGFALRYFDALGAELTSLGDAARIHRVAVTARGAGRSGLSGAGAVSRDSETIVVRVRNE